MTTLHKPLVTAFATLVVLLVALALGLLMGGCERAGVVALEEDIDQLGVLIRSGQLRYAQDSASGNCFAYAFVVRKGFTSKDDVGGPVITWVPCDALMVERWRDVR